MLLNQMEEGVSDRSGIERENRARRRKEEEEWIGSCVPCLIHSWQLPPEVASVGHDSERELLWISILISSSTSLNGRELSLFPPFQIEQMESRPCGRAHFAPLLLASLSVRAAAFRVIGDE
jgi:hypothetical protein